MALSFVLGTCAVVGAGDKEKKDEVKKAEVKKDGDKAKAEKPQREKKPKADRAKKTPQDRFNALDADGNKKLSLAEFVGKREARRKTKPEAISQETRQGLQRRL